MAKLVLSAQWGLAVSKNPFLQFTLKGAKAGDKVARGQPLALLAERRGDHTAAASFRRRTSASGRSRSS